MAQSEETMDILLVADVKENLFKYAEIVELSGLSCSTMDISGLALAKCMEINYGLPKWEVVSLMNIGASLTNFVI